jgi:hypothetical protein
MEKCSNCGRVIGNLETPQIWQVHVVCPGCHITLAAADAATPSLAISGGRIARLPPRSKPLAQLVRRGLLLVSLAGAVTYIFGIFEAHTATTSLDIDYANNLQVGGMAIFAIAEGNERGNERGRS